jgi:hypothetical protein
LRFRGGETPEEVAGRKYQYFSLLKLLDIFTVRHRRGLPLFRVVIGRFEYVVIAACVVVEAPWLFGVQPAAHAVSVGRDHSSNYTSPLEITCIILI